MIGDASRKRELADELTGTGVEVLAGAEDVIEAAQRPSEMVVSARLSRADPAPVPPWQWRKK